MYGDHTWGWLFKCAHMAIRYLGGFNLVGQRRGRTQRVGIYVYLRVNLACARSSCFPLKGRQRLKGVCAKQPPPRGCRGIVAVFWVM